MDVEEEEEEELRRNCPTRIHSCEFCEDLIRRDRLFAESQSEAFLFLKKIKNKKPSSLKMGSADITGASEEAALTGLGANSDTQGMNPAGGRWILTAAPTQGGTGDLIFLTLTKSRLMPDTQAHSVHRSPG